MHSNANVRFKFVFQKTGPMVYISHLDLMRLLTRSIRRAGLPIALSQGFTPRPRLSLARAGKLGVDLFDQQGELSLREPAEADGVMHRWQAVLPEGIELTTFVPAGDEKESEEVQRT